MTIAITILFILLAFGIEWYTLVKVRANAYQKGYNMGNRVTFQCLDNEYRRGFAKGYISGMKEANGTYRALLAEAKVQFSQRGYQKGYRAGRRKERTSEMPGITNERGEIVHT